MTREKRLKKRAERRGRLRKAEAAEAYQHATTPPALEAANKISWWGGIHTGDVPTVPRTHSGRGRNPT